MNYLPLITAILNALVSGLQFGLYKRNNNKMFAVASILFLIAAILQFISFIGINNLIS